MIYEDKLEAIYCMLHKDGAKLHFLLQDLGYRPWFVGFNDYQHWINQKVIDEAFNLLAHKEYLKKKAEFLLPLRDSKGRFKSNNK